MYDPVAEFPELFREEKPTELPPLREPLENMQHRIDVMPNSVWKPRFASTYDQFKYQITKNIITELDTGRIVPSKSSNSIAIFKQPRRDKPQEARCLLDCIHRNLVTYQDKTPMPSMEQIQDFIGCRPFISKLDLTDEYHNIRMYPDSVSHSIFSCQMGKSDSPGMQQGDCNGHATMTRAMNYLFRQVKDQMIHLDDILIANHTYEEDIKTISQVLQIAKQNKLWFDRYNCNFISIQFQLPRRLCCGALVPYDRYVLPCLPLRPVDLLRSSCPLQSLYPPPVPFPSGGALLRPCSIHSRVLYLLPLHCCSVTAQVRDLPRMGIPLPNSDYKTYTYNAI